MIRLTEEYSCERDLYGWVLVRERPATEFINPKTEPATGMSVRRTYHSNLEQIVNYLLDASCAGLSANDTATIQDLKDHLLNMRRQMQEILPPQFTRKKAFVVKLPKSEPQKTIKTITSVDDEDFSDPPGWIGPSVHESALD